MRAKVFSIQIFQCLHQIPPRVCTLVLFISFISEDDLSTDAVSTKNDKQIVAN